MIPKPYLKAAAILLAVVVALAIQTLLLPDWVAGTIAFVVIGFAVVFWPVVMVSGIVYGSGNERTFYCGAAVSAVMPYLIQLLVLFDMGPFYFRNFGGPFPGHTFELLLIEWHLASPCICGFLGGLAALAMRQRLVEREGNLAAKRFGLSTLMIGMTVIAVFFGIVSAAPLFLMGMLFGLFLPPVPAILLVGLIEGRNNTRAFFIGALTAGAVPLIIANVFLLTFGLRGFGYGDEVGFRIFSGVALIGPFIPMVIGGLISRRMRQSLQPAIVVLQPIPISKEMLNAADPSPINPAAAESLETT